MCVQHKISCLQGNQENNVEKNAGTSSRVIQEMQWNSNFTQLGVF